MMPLPCAVAATRTCTGFAVAQKIRQTSGQALTWVRTLMGKAFFSTRKKV